MITPSGRDLTEGEYLYSTQPLLAWILNHYFYRATHYVWCAGVFFPYRLKNPKSSSPYEMYADLFQPCVDKDQYDRFIIQLRQSLRDGVISKSGALGAELAARLKVVCSFIDVEFFAPVVYRVSREALTDARLNRSKGSAVVGSDEYLVSDLREEEFDILFADCLRHEEYTDHDVQRALSGAMRRRDLIRLLESRSDRS